MQLESKHNIVKYILAFGSVQGLNIAIGLVRNKLVAMLLGPKGMGIIALYNSAISMIQNLSNLGLDKSGIPIVSQACESGDEKAISESILRLRSLFVMAAMLAVGAGLSLSWLLALVAFGNMNHTLQFMALSPVAGLMIMSVGETVVLKATRKLKKLAILSLINVVIASIITVLLFYVWGSAAIIPMLLITALAQMLVTMGYSYRLYAPHFSLNLDTIRSGLPIIKLGIAFIVAGSLTSGVEFLIRSLLNNMGSDATLGLYNVGYMISFTYANIVFSSLDAEYFPRLSATLGHENDIDLTRATIRRQIKISLLVIIPLIAVVVVLLPWIVPLLFSDVFSDAVPMGRVTLIAMIFRAVYLPIGYLPLAKGDSKTFLLLEVLSSLFLLLFVYLGYMASGLLGCGIGIAVSNFTDIILNVVICRWKYGRVV